MPFFENVDDYESEPPDYDPDNDENYEDLIFVDGGEDDEQER